MPRSFSKTNSNTNSALVYAALIISLVALMLSTASYLQQKTVYINQTKTVYVNGTTVKNVTLTHYNITSSLITPVYYLPQYPQIIMNDTPGTTLSGLNTPLTAANLSIINNEPNSYFENAGERYLNSTLTDSIGIKPAKVPPFMVNGKPSVIYLGSITCIFCAENRWAMALALSRFGNFSALFTGYSSLGDGDVPTLYWSPATYNASAVDLGSFYSSKYINFIPIEDTDPITGGFNMQNLPTIQYEVNQSGNLAYKDAMAYLLQINTFAGTPYTIWGKDQLAGADAVVFGNSTATAPQPLESWTHGQVYSQLGQFNDQFAWSEYAAADQYVAMICGAINNTAPVCSLPAIIQIKKMNGY